MAVNDPSVVDAIGVEQSSGKVVLTISDHLDWSDQNGHELQLQDKLNRYLSFIESGEIMETYPDAQGRSLVIDVVARVPPSPAGVEFLTKVAEILTAAGIEFRTRVLT